jgi:hypothetical protein
MFTLCSHRRQSSFVSAPMSRPLAGLGAGWKSWATLVAREIRRLSEALVFRALLVHI